MELQHIFVLVLLFFCVHDYIRAVPVQQTEISPSKDENITTTTKLPSVSRACSSTRDCYPHSKCIGGVCECDRGWYTRQEDAPCSYEQKSKLTAFLLSFFLGGVGADWFYLARGQAGYIAAGVFKMLAACGCFSAIFRGCSEGSDGLAACAGCISLIMSCGEGVWWLVDWIRILADAFPDGNGAALYTW